MAKGAAEHAARLRAMRAKIARVALAHLYAGGQEIEIEAEISITQGSISGKGHIPSKPGEPPNADTRRLDTSIETVIAAHMPPTVHVVSNAPYSAALEFGTSRMAERPFMRPATRKKKAKLIEQVKRAADKVSRGSR